MKIVAKGKKAGIVVTVTAYNEGKKVVFDFEGCDEVFADISRESIDFELKLRHPFAATYCPKVYEGINVMNVLENYFFDELLEFKAEDIEPMECIEGRVY